MNLQNIQAIVLDVDGVLTDGRLYFTEAGESMMTFYVQDGTAIRAWQKRGRKVAFLSGRNSPIVAARAQDLGVERVLQGQLDKLKPFRQLVDSWSLRPDHVCYVGDDTLDIPPMQACGFAVAVANAVPEVKKHAQYITKASGGAGAVREIIDYLLSHSEAR